jgi:hypothetical protein
VALAGSMPRPEAEFLRTEAPAAPEGPTWLADAPIAQVVQDAIIFGAEKRYDLYAWCIMANHVHIVIQPMEPLSKITL